MEDFDDYNALELFKLLEYLRRDPFPGLYLKNKKTKIREEIAKRLEVDPKEVGWVMPTPQKEKKQREQQDQEQKEKKPNNRRN